MLTKKLIFLVTLTSFLISCQPSKKPVTVSDCVVQVQKLYDKELKCTTKGAMEVNLYSGRYQNDTVYFAMIMCPNCDSTPPAYGYTCTQEKVTFSDFRDVSQIRQVYNSCTKQFIE